jgi:osmotically-inducible protein OsmY
MSRSLVLILFVSASILSTVTASEGQQEPKTSAHSARYPLDKGKSAEDRKINEKIRDKCTVWFIHMYKDVVLDTEDGIVKLRGAVNHYEDVEKIKERINKVEGVKKIEEQLYIKAK